MAASALVLGHTGSVRGLKGGVKKLLDELKEKSDRLEEPPVLQKIREEETSALPGQRGKVVVYITSMQAVRDTYEQCQNVLQILRTHQVAFVPKDIYLHPDYSKELRLRLGESRQVTVPQLYIDGEYVGGREVVQELNESGELVSTLKGFMRRMPNFRCLLCQGQGFIVCMWCKGSKKGIKTNFGDLKCTVCNQNALQKCPECSSL